MKKFQVYDEISWNGAKELKNVTSELVKVQSP